jgi:hypothetical protein
MTEQDETTLVETYTRLTGLAEETAMPQAAICLLASGLEVLIVAGSSEQLASIKAATVSEQETRIHEHNAAALAKLGES